MNGGFGFFMSNKLAAAMGSGAASKANGIKSPKSAADET